MLPYVLFPTWEVHHLMFSNAFDTMEGLKKKSSQLQIYGKSLYTLAGVLRCFGKPKSYAAPAGDPGIGLEQLELMCKV
ncbi:hypothetical protein YC2023_049116 [Brassica napus]